MELLEFAWARCLDGYRREPKKLLSAKMEAKLKTGRWVNVDPHPGSEMIRPNSDRFERTQPLKNVLFKIFADWEATPDGMVHFCNAYGQLWIPGASGIEQVDWLLAEQKALRHVLKLLNAGDPSQLIRRFDVSWAGGCVFKLRRSDGGSLLPVLIPESLIQAMWFQLALYAANPNIALLSCQRCRKPFYVGTGTKRRSTAKYCSNACKVADFKARQEA